MTVSILLALVLVAIVIAAGSRLLRTIALVALIASAITISQDTDLAGLDLPALLDPVIERAREIGQDSLKQISQP